MEQAKTSTAFVTFYSFKGGVGRSMALINTAGILAGRGFRVLVIDLDLEAPGLSYLSPAALKIQAVHSHSESNREDRVQLGIVDLLSDAKTRGSSADLFSLPVEKLAEKYTQLYELPTGLGESREGSLRIMPAGNFDNEYATRFDSLNLRELYHQGVGEPLIRAFKKRLVDSDQFDYVLVDSRTGFSDEAGICTRDLADHLMILSGLNRQNVEGTSQFLRALHASKSEGVTFQIILSPVPNGEDALLDGREAAARAAFELACGRRVNLSLQIPYHPQLALTEEPHIFRRRRGYLFEAYRSIERSMLSALGHDAWAHARTIERHFAERNLAIATREIKRLIRLDGGREQLAALAYKLATDSFEAQRTKSDKKAGESQVPLLSEVLKTLGGQEIVEFIVDNVAIDQRSFHTERLIDALADLSLDLAERFHKRIINTIPQAQSFIAYAQFLLNYRKDLDLAEKIFERAVERDPKDFEALVEFAKFKRDRRNNLVDAAELYRRALEVDPTDSHTLGDYGQLLASLGEFVEASQRLFDGFRYLDKDETANAAEFCFALWLTLRVLNRNAEYWERCYKYYMHQNFRRHEWSFTAMLKQAVKYLSEEEYEYASAMADAFLDRRKIAKLSKIQRWARLPLINPVEIPFEEFRL